MPARRFFVRDAHHAGEVVAVHGSDAHKIVNVLRLRNGDVIEVVDSAGSIFAATLETKDGALHARLGEAHAPAVTARVAIDVAQGIPKGQKMDFVVEKLGELGVRNADPVAERTDHRSGPWRSKARALAPARAQFGSAERPL